MSYRAILFDAAETLFTTQGTVGEIYADVAKKYGSTATPDEIQQAFKQSFQSAPPLTNRQEQEWWKSVVRDTFAAVAMIQDFDRFFDEVYGLFRDSKGWILFPETREVLESLRGRSVDLGVVSNFDSRLYSVLESLGISKYFRSVTISSEAGYAKPDPRIFIAAAQSTGWPPDRTVMVGDNLVDDYRGSESAGLHAILVDRTDQYAGLKSVRRISNLGEVLPMFPNG